MSKRPASTAYPIITQAIGEHIKEWCIKYDPTNNCTWRYNHEGRDIPHMVIWRRGSGWRYKRVQVWFMSRFIQIEFTHEQAGIRQDFINVEYEHPAMFNHLEEALRKLVKRIYY